jgi:hypothetical protein
MNGMLHTGDEGDDLFCSHYVRIWYFFRLDLFKDLTKVSLSKL